MADHSIYCDCKDCPDAERIKVAEQHEDRLIILRRVQGKTHKREIPFSSHVPKSADALQIPLDNKVKGCVSSK